MSLWILMLAWLGCCPLLPLLRPTLWFDHGVVVGALAALALPRLLRAPSVRLPVPAVAIGLALLSLAVALIASGPSVSSRDMQWTALTGALYAVFFGLCLYLLPGAEAPPAEVRRAARMLAVLLLAVVAGQTGAVLVQGQIGSAEVRTPGTLGNPNAFGSLLAAAAVTLAALLRRARPWQQVLAVAPPLLLVVATQSRGTVAALVVTLVLLAVRLKARKLLAGLAAAVVLVALVPNPLRDRVVEMRPEHQFARTFLWGAAVKGIAEHPLGIGPAMNRYIFPRVAYDRAHPWLLHQRHTVGLTHNVFLTIALEWGWLAGAALVVLAWWSGRRLLQPGGPGRDDPLLLPAALGACVLFLELQVDGIEQNPFTFSMFLLLLAVALARVMPTATRWSAPGKLVGALLAGAVLACGWVMLQRAEGLRALLRADDAAEAFARGESGANDVRAAYDAAERALPGTVDTPMHRYAFERALLQQALAPDEPMPPSAWPLTTAVGGESERLEEREADQRDNDEGGGPAPERFRRVAPVILAPAEVDASAAAARLALRQARSANGLDARLPRTAGRFELWLARHAGKDIDTAVPGALADLEAALELDPLDVEAHWELAQEALRAGRPELHSRELATVFRLAPEYAYAFYVTARQEDLAGNLEVALYFYDRAERALALCRERVLYPSLTSQAFYERNLSRLDEAGLRRHIDELRRSMYF